MSSAATKLTCAWVNKKLDEYEQQENDDTIMLRAMISEIIDRLALEGLVYRQRFTPSMVGVDPSNRYGDGLDPERVHKLLLAIFKAGWSWDEVGQAICREVGHNEHEALAFQVELAIDSDEMLAPASPDTMKVFTLSCGHTTAALACVLAGAKAHLEDLQFLCFDGRLSLAKLRELQPKFAEAVDTGLEYKTIRHVVIELCPRLSTYVQEAYNLSHSAAQIETCFQVLRKVYFEAARHQKRDVTPPWDAIKKKIGATRPAHALHVAGYAAFVKAHVDKDGLLLQRIGAYLKSVPGKASVRGSLYATLAQQQCTDMPEYVEMVIKAMYKPREGELPKGWCQHPARLARHRCYRSKARAVREASCDHDEGSHEGLGQR